MQSSALLAALGLAGALASTALVPRATALEPAVGPPAICHPIEIGDARTLPWGSDGWRDLASSYSPSRAVADATGILSASDDALVHMETLRRAVLYVTKEKGGAADLAAALREQLIARLVEADGKQDGRAVALAWFDLGYAQAALRQLGHGEGVDEAGALRQAERLLPDDGAAHLGLALARWTGHDEPSRDVWRHLDVAAKKAQDPDGLLRANLIGTSAHFLGLRTHEDLAAAIARHVGRG